MLWDSKFFLSELQNGECDGNSGKPFNTRKRTGNIEYFLKIISIRDIMLFYIRRIEETSNLIRVKKQKSNQNSDQNNNNDDSSDDSSEDENRDFKINEQIPKRKSPKKISWFDIYALLNSFSHLRNNDISTLKSIKIYLDPESIHE